MDKITVQEQNELNHAINNADQDKTAEIFLMLKEKYHWSPDESRTYYLHLMNTLGKATQRVVVKYAYFLATNRKLI